MQLRLVLNGLSIVWAPTKSLETIKARKTKHITNINRVQLCVETNTRQECDVSICIVYCTSIEFTYAISSSTSDISAIITNMTRAVPIPNISIRNSKDMTWPICAILQMRWTKSAIEISSSFTLLAYAGQHMQCSSVSSTKPDHSNWQCRLAKSCLQ